MQENQKKLFFKMVMDIRTVEDVNKIAMINHWKLNSNEKLVSSILNAQNELFKSTGQFYCPCKRKRTEENVCPCKNAAQEIILKGHCHCMLFINDSYKMSP